MRQLMVTFFLLAFKAGTTIAVQFVVTGYWHHKAGPCGESVRGLNITHVGTLVAGILCHGDYFSTDEGGSRLQSGLREFSGDDECTWL